MKKLLIVGMLVILAGDAFASQKTRVRLTITSANSVNQMRTEIVGADPGTPSKTTCDSPPVTCQTFGSGTNATTTCNSAPVTCTTTPGRPASPGVPQEVIGRVDNAVSVDADNGYRYTIACEANWSGSNCTSFPTGWTSYADLDGGTMWIYFQNTNRNGKLTKAKYRIVSGGPIAPPVAAQGQGSQPAPPPSGQAVALSPASTLPPVKGEAPVRYTQPVTKRQGALVIKQIRVMNPSGAPILQLRIVETWFDKAGRVITSSTGMVNRLEPGETATVIIESAFSGGMNSNSYNFSHGNGTVRPVRVDRLP